MALDVTVGGPNSDSYIDVANADTYFANHWSVAKASAWAALNTSQKEAVLRRACKLLDSMRVLDTELGYGVLPPQFVERYRYDLTIHRQMANQALNFPRNIDCDINGTPFIPSAVPDAQCEQAVYLLAFDDSAIAARLTGISEETLSAGPVRTHTVYKPFGNSFAPAAVDLMRPYLRPTRTVQRA